MQLDLTLLPANRTQEGLARQELPRGAPVGMEAVAPLVPTPRGQLLREREMRELVARCVGWLGRRAQRGIHQTARCFGQ